MTKQKLSGKIKAYNAETNEVVIQLKFVPKILQLDKEVEIKDLKC